MDEIEAFLDESRADLRTLAAKQRPLMGTSNNHNFFVGSIVGAAPMILAHNLS
jgi:hypothetical protein